MSKKAKKQDSGRRAKKSASGKNKYLSDTALERGNPFLSDMPQEDIKESKDSHVAETVNECMVVFLGDPGSGKSSLIARMTGHPFDENPILRDDVQMTNLEKTAPDGKTYNLRFLDFGEQEIVYSMYRCFPVEHAVYVIVCGSDTDGRVDDVIARWLKTVQPFSNECPVILALNKADKYPNVSVNEHEVKKLYPALKRVIKTSAARSPEDKYGVKYLLDEILKAAPDCIQEMSGSRIYLRLKQRLEEMQCDEKETRKDYLTSNEFREECENYHIADNLREGLLKWFQDLGVAYTYDCRLQRWYVLNPVWLTKGVSLLMLCTSEQGFLRHNDILEKLRTSNLKIIGSNKNYSPEEMNLILCVMHKFEISYEISQGVEMVPLKMPTMQPDSANDYPFDRAIHLRWDATYLPDNLVYLLIIDMRRNLYKGPDGKYCVWRRGARFQRNDCDALASMDKKGLDVYVYGVDSSAARAYMENFREAVAGILSDLNIDAAEMIYYTKDGFTGKISYKSAMEQISRRPQQELFISSIDSGEGQFVSAKDLLGSIYPDWEKKVALFQSSREHEAEISRTNAETEKIHAEADKAKAEAEKARAEASQTSTDNEIKRHREWWIRILVWGLATLLLIVTAVLIILTVLGVINWSEIASTLISFVLFWLLVKTKLEK